MGRPSMSKLYGDISDGVYWGLSISEFMMLNFNHRVLQTLEGEIDGTSGSYLFISHSSARNAEHE